MLSGLSYFIVSQSTTYIYTCTAAFRATPGQPSCAKTAVASSCTAAMSRFATATALAVFSVYGISIASGIASITP